MGLAKLLLGIILSLPQGIFCTILYSLIWLLYLISVLKQKCHSEYSISTYLHNVFQDMIRTWWLELFRLDQDISQTLLYLKSICSRQIWDSLDHGTFEPWSLRTWTIQYSGYQVGSWRVFPSTKREPIYSDLDAVPTTIFERGRAKFAWDIHCIPWGAVDHEEMNIPLRDV